MLLPATLAVLFIVVLVGAVLAAYRIRTGAPMPETDSNVAVGIGVGIAVGAAVGLTTWSATGEFVWYAVSVAIGLAIGGAIGRTTSTS